MNPEKCSRYIGELALKALLYEVSASPKPGLVDRMDHGSHEDMDYFTFIDSATAICDDFRQMAYEGCLFDGADLGELFAVIRRIGVGTEAKMFETTGGINTHKGIIFSIGILSALAGFLMTQHEQLKVNSGEICGYVPVMVGNLCRELRHLPDDRPLTNGEKLYQQYGITGIRGEVSSGFSSVMETGVQVIKAHAGKFDRDQVLVTALLSIMTITEDSNVLHRQGMEGLQYVRRQAADAFEVGGMTTEEGRRAVAKMTEDFKLKRISPGGSADLLAVAVFICLLEGVSFEKTALLNCENIKIYN